VTLGYVQDTITRITWAKGMEQIAEQSSPQRRGNPAWTKGVSGNPRGSLSKAEKDALVRRKAQALALGIAWKGLGALDREYLLKAATLLGQRPRRHEDTIRGINAANRLIATVERRKGAAKRDDGFASLDLPELRLP
jgi:hypothetical protein